MSIFKVGDSVTIYPEELQGFIKDIDTSGTYPITVYHKDKYEGGYTLDGFRYLNPAYKDTHYIELATKPKSRSIPEYKPTPLSKSNNYWTIVRANSSFIQLSHPKLQDKLIPIHIIKAIEIVGVNVFVYTSEHSELNLGPILIQHVADILFSHEINSI